MFVGPELESFVVASLFVPASAGGVVWFELEPQAKPSTLRAVTAMIRAIMVRPFQESQVNARDGQSAKVTPFPRESSLAQSETPRRHARASDADAP
jgi:hypothetical protein